MKMAVDTNILIRLLTGDIPELVKKAKGLINKCDKHDIFISYGVITETYFSLKYHYKFKEETALNAVEDILKIKQFNIEQKTAVQLAVNKARSGYGFFDALIGEIGAVKNLKTYTFDKGLKDNSAFVVI